MSSQQNMLLGRQNELLLSDFGTAVVAQSSRYQGSQDMAGTVAYMAPEQVQAHPRPASDQYSLGIVVYEWLSGDRPFHGSFTEVIAKHAFAPPPPLREKIPSILPAVEQVVMTALEKDPSKRFASVSAFALALEQASRSAQPYPSYFPSSSPNEMMLPTVITPPREHSQPASKGTPPAQSWQISDPSPPSNRVDLSSFAPTRIASTPVQSRHDNQRGPRRPIMVGLLLLLAVGLLIVGLVFSPFLTNLFGNPAPSPTSNTWCQSFSYSLPKCSGQL
jgi:serine/threonine protein kinase